MLRNRTEIYKNLQCALLSPAEATQLACPGCLGQLRQFGQPGSQTDLRLALPGWAWAGLVWPAWLSGLSGQVVSLLSSARSTAAVFLRAFSLISPRSVYFYGCVVMSWKVVD